MADDAAVSILKCPCLCNFRGFLEGKGPGIVFCLHSVFSRGHPLGKCVHNTGCEPEMQSISKFRSDIVPIGVLLPHHFHGIPTCPSYRSRSLRSRTIHLTGLIDTRINASQQDDEKITAARSLERSAVSMS